MKKILNLKKVKSIMSENILYAIRENLIVGPILLLFLSIFLFSLIGKGVFLGYLQEISYIGTIGTIQYILILLITVYITINSFDKDVKSKNIYITLQHSQRKEFFLGKVFSNILILSILNVIQLILTFLGYVYIFKDFNWDILYIFLFQQLEIIVLVFLISLITLFFNKNVVRLIIFGVIFVLGHLLYGIKELIYNGILDLPASIDKLVTVLYYILPNLEAFNVKKLVIIDNNLGSMFAGSVIYLIAEIVILYTLSMYILNKKDF